MDLTYSIIIATLGKKTRGNCCVVVSWSLTHSLTHLVSLLVGWLVRENTIALKIYLFEFIRSAALKGLNILSKHC